MADSDSDILQRLMANNRSWAAQVDRDNPGFFERLSKQQTPRVLWIGCSDSRVPGNESLGFMPGEIYYHRSVGNQLQMADLAKRGVRFMVCGLASRRLAGRIAGQTGDAESVLKEFGANLVPSGRIVPAGVVGVTHAQERGFALLYVG